MKMTTRIVSLILAALIPCQMAMAAPQKTSSIRRSSLSRKATSKKKAFQKKKNLQKSSAKARGGRPGTGSQTPIPSVKTQILVDTIKSVESEQSESFYNGLFVNKADGGDFEICGRVQSSKLDPQNLNLDIDGQVVALTPTSSTSYSYCHITSVDSQDDDRFFNNVFLQVQERNGATFAKRITLVNSSQRATTSNIHKEAAQIYLAQDDYYGDGADYLSHVVNDALYSQIDTISEKIAYQWYHEILPACNLIAAYNNAQEELHWFWDMWDAFKMQLAEVVYYLIYDWNMNEGLYVCFEEITMDEPELQVSFGQTETYVKEECVWDESDIDVPSEMDTHNHDSETDGTQPTCDYETVTDESRSMGTNMRIDGTLRNVKARLKFKHTADNSQTLEEGTMILSLGDVDLNASINDLDLTEGHLSGNLKVEHVETEEVEVYWEEFIQYDVYMEGENSSMEFFVEKINEKIQEEYPNGLDVDHVSYSSINVETDSEGSVRFDSTPEIFQLKVKEIQAEAPHGEQLTSLYSMQKGYRTTPSAAIPYVSSDFGFAIDDDILNNQLHNMTKLGVFNYDSTQPQTGGNGLEVDLSQCLSQSGGSGGSGSSSDIKLKVDVAPIMVFASTSSYDLDLQINNAKITVDSKIKYSADIRTKIDIEDSGSSGDMIDLAFNVYNKPDLDLYVLEKGIDIPSALERNIEKMFDCVMQEVLDVAAEQTNEQANAALETAFDTLPMDICTEVHFDGARARDGLLIVDLEFDWNDEISNTDACFESSAQPVGTPTGEYDEDPTPTYDCDDTSEFEDGSFYRAPIC